MKSFRKWVSALTALLLCVQCLPVSIQAAAPFSGSGTAEDPYLIENAADLREMSDLVNADPEYGNSSYEMTADIDLEGAAFMPIGTNDHKFSGTFDGNGYAVSNLNVDVSSEPSVRLCRTRNDPQCRRGERNGQGDDPRRRSGRPDDVCGDHQLLLKGRCIGIE